MEYEYKGATTTAQRDSKTKSGLQGGSLSCSNYRPTGQNSQIFTILSCEPKGNELCVQYKTRTDNIQNCRLKFSTKQDKNAFKIFADKSKGKRRRLCTNQLVIAKLMDE